MSEFDASDSEKKIKIEFEPEYLPKEIVYDPETEESFTLDRRLTKMYPVDSTTRFISYIFLPNNDTDSKSKGKFIYGAARNQLAHQEMFRIAQGEAFGIIDEKLDDWESVRGGGILVLRKGVFEYYRESDTYGEVENDKLFQQFVGAINREYPEYADGY